MPQPIRNYRDTIFRMLFREKKELLSLFNALRDLFYVSKLLEELTRKRDIYAGKRIVLPVPQFIVFYNGREPQPERREFYLSESFARRPDHPNLELIVVQLNINPGYNEELVSSCKTLAEYVQYTERVRRYSQDLPLAEAVEKAVQECIEKDILADFLRKNRGERCNTSSMYY